MIRKYFFTLLILISTFSISIAQQNVSVNPQRGISVGYWGPLIGTWWGMEATPWGLKVGYENYFLKTEKYNVLGRSSIVFQQMLDKYTAGGITFSSALQRSFKCGLYIEQSFILGYLGSYYNFDVYSTNSDGEVVNKGKKLFSSVIYGYALGIGYDLRKMSKVNMKLFFNPTLYNKVPNNDNLFLMYNYSFDFGVVLYPKWIQKK